MIWFGTWIDVLTQILRRSSYVFILWTPLKSSDQEPRDGVIRRSRTIFSKQDSWSQSQMLLQAICKWLLLEYIPIVMKWSDFITHISNDICLQFESFMSNGFHLNPEVNFFWALHWPGGSASWITNSMSTAVAERKLDPQEHGNCSSTLSPWIGLVVNHALKSTNERYHYVMWLSLDPYAAARIIVTELCTVYVWSGTWERDRPGFSPRFAKFKSLSIADKLSAAVQALSSYDATMEGCRNI